jgi:hypothetical protein
MAVATDRYCRVVRFAYAQVSSAALCYECWARETSDETVRLLLYYLASRRRVQEVFLMELAATTRIGLGETGGSRTLDEAIRSVPDRPRSKAPLRRLLDIVCCFSASLIDYYDTLLEQEQEPDLLYLVQRIKEMEERFVRDMRKGYIQLVSERFYRSINRVFEMGCPEGIGSGDELVAT